MKKTLRFSMIALLTMLSGVAMAQEVTLDFSTNDAWNLPVKADSATATQSYNNGTYTIKLTAGTDAESRYYFNADGYLMLGKTGATLELPAFNFEVGQIVVTGRSKASGSVLQNIYVGDAAVSTQTKGAQVANKYDIAAASQAAGTVYTLKVESKHNTQIVNIQIYKKGSAMVEAPDSNYVYKKASAIESGKRYILAANVNDTLKVATPVSGNYGYLQVSPITPAAEEFQLSTEKDYAFTFTAVEGGYTIQQADGKYLYMKGTYTSFNVSSNVQTDGSHIWTVTANADGTLSIVNTVKNRTVQYDTKYKTYGAYDDITNPLPSFYLQGEKVESNEVEKPEADITNTPETAYTVAKAKQLIAAGEGLSTAVYVKGYVTTIDEVNLQYGNATYYINDEKGNKTGEFMIFRGYHLNDKKFEEEEQLNLGDEVIVYGYLKDHYGTQEMTGSYIYSQNGIVSGINDIKLDENAVKVIYNLQGQRVDNPTKGIYIVNGKKVVIK